MLAIVRTIGFGFLQLRSTKMLRGPKYRYVKDVRTKDVASEKACLPNDRRRSMRQYVHQREPNLVLELAIRCGDA